MTSRPATARILNRNNNRANNGANNRACTMRVGEQA